MKIIIKNLREFSDKLISIFIIEEIFVNLFIYKFLFLNIKIIF